MIANLAKLQDIKSMCKTKLRFYTLTIGNPEEK